MEINKIKYFDTEVDMVIVDNCLAIGEYEKNKTYVVESIFSNESYLDIMDAEELLDVYGVNVKEISYFNH